jgi:DNA-binding transcriptional LysR family regulator
MDHISPPLPPLDALRAFEAAARLGSFTAAAHDLHLTHGAISRQVAKLEHWLGEKLFDRQARGVALTPQGQRLHQRTSEAFALIADSSDRWTERRGAAIVRLTTIPSVSSLWLMPRLRAFESGNLPLRIEFVVEHRNTDLEAEGIDLAIRCGRGSLPGRVSVRLFEEQCFPIASPTVAGSLGTGAPERILDYPLVHDSDASGWRAWFAAQGMDYRPRPQDRRFEDYNLVLDAAAYGLGVALARPPLAGEALCRGRVVAVDPRMALNPVSYWLDRPSSRLRPSAAELARRIMAEAGLTTSAVETFLKT